MKIIDTGVIGIPVKEEAARKFFEWAKKVGVTTIVSEPDPAALPLIDKVAGDFGIKVAIHDHPKPSRYWDPEFTYGLIRDRKNIGFCADVGHWKRSGLEPADVLTKYGENVYSLHFKDLVPAADAKKLHDVPWGEGQSKAVEMLAALKAKKFKGPSRLNLNTNGTCRPCRNASISSTSRPTSWRRNNDSSRSKPLQPPSTPNSGADGGLTFEKVAKRGTKTRTPHMVGSRHAANFRVHDVGVLSPPRPHC